jgi:hypothetical protein
LVVAETRGVQVTASLEVKMVLDSGLDQELSFPPTATYWPLA